MRRIPLYDATAPIVCTLGADDRAARVALLEELRSQLDDIERTEHGLLLRFPDRPELEPRVRAFAADEHDCCRFWGFAVEHGDGALTLQWDAPPAADELLERLLAWFRGDDSTAALAGLL